MIERRHRKAGLAAGAYVWSTEQLFRNEGVWGSNPSCGTKSSHYINQLKTVGSPDVVEFVRGETPGKRQQRRSTLAYVSIEGRGACARFSSTSLSAARMLEVGQRSEPIHPRWNQMPAFARYVGIDYSGAQTPSASLKGLRVYMAEADAPPIEVMPPPSPRKYWTRRGIAEWLVRPDAPAPTPTPTVIGIDHGFSFPLRYFFPFLERRRPLIPGPSIEIAPSLSAVSVGTARGIDLPRNEGPVTSIIFWRAVNGATC